MDAPRQVEATSRVRQQALESLAVMLAIALLGVVAAAIAAG